MPSVTYDQVLRVRQQLYNSHLTEGKLTPFVYPWDTFPILYLFIALIVTPRLTRQSARLWNVTTLLLVAGHSTYIVVNRRCLSMASGYIGGLSMSWGTLITAVLLLLHDPRKDFARLEWREIRSTKSKDKALNSEHGDVRDSPDLRKRKQTTKVTGDPTSGLAPESNYKLVWQMMPNGLGHRIDWTIDLITSFRGPNWNFRIPTLTRISAPPAPTNSIRLSSSLETIHSVVFETSYTSSAASEFRFRAVVKTIVLYLLIDVVKVVMISDPYFLGLARIDSPSAWRIIPVLHTYTGLSVFFITRSLRLIISLIGILNALTLIFSLSSTIVYSTLPKIISPRKFTYSPLLDTRFFPALSAPPFPIISDTGLAGFWGQYWHQMFRFGITEPSKPILRYLNISKTSKTGRAIQVFIAFGLSGALHMNASYGCFSIMPSQPLMPLFFFLSQGVGILVLTAASDFCLKTLRIRVPRSVRKLTNVLFTVTWLYVTGPLLADDFARCGIWLFEPIPISPIRGFRGEGWFTWRDIKVEWWNGLEGKKTPFWEKGIGIF